MKLHDHAVVTVVTSMSLSGVMSWARARPRTSHVKVMQAHVGHVRRVSLPQRIMFTPCRYIVNTVTVKVKHRENRGKHAVQKCRNANKLQGTLSLVSVAVRCAAHCVAVRHSFRQNLQRELWPFTQLFDHVFQLMAEEMLEVTKEATVMTSQGLVLQQLLPARCVDLHLKHDLRALVFQENAVPLLSKEMPQREQRGLGSTDAGVGRADGQLVKPIPQQLGSDDPVCQDCIKCIRKEVKVLLQIRHSHLHL